jgi:AraC family transcriptional regulator
MKNNILLKSVLMTIEEKLQEGINVELIASEFDLSSRHLQRLFKIICNQSLGLYIRSRKLAASIDDLFNTDLNILDIAISYGFEYEQSYIRSFKREYGITPGDLRKTWQIVKIKHPLQFLSSSKYANGLITEPDIVVVPKFHVIGKKYELPLNYKSNLVCQLIKKFIINERKHISNAINQNLIINIATEAGIGADFCFIMPSIQVKSLENTPEGFTSYTFPASLCLRFSFINFCINANFPVEEMIKTFIDYESQKNILERKISIDLFHVSDYDNCFKLWERLSPVTF